MRVLPVLVAVAVAAAGVVATGPAALADTSALATVAAGNDVSYPQCATTLPSRGDIAVVGVNAGTGVTTNPCLAAQLAWGDAAGPDGTAAPADVYVNTANPGRLGDWWPGSDLTRTTRPVVNPIGSCAGAEDAACAYVYGYSVADDDVRIRGVTSPAARTWWLDVETMNSWSWSHAANLAVLEGMADAIRAAGADVGIYSTARQWSLIVGTTTPSSALAGAPSWIAGAVTRSSAVANCRTAPFTPGGRVRMAQWVEHGLDHDIACATGVSGAVPAVTGTPQVGLRLVADPGRWGPTGVTLHYRWTRDGVDIAGADQPVYTPVAADVAASIGVRVTGSRLGAPPLSLTSTPVLVQARPTPSAPPAEGQRLSLLT